MCVPRSSRLFPLAQAQYKSQFVGALEDGLTHEDTGHHPLARTNVPGFVAASTTGTRSLLLVHAASTTGARFSLGRFNTRKEAHVRCPNCQLNDTATRFANVLCKPMTCCQIMSALPVLQLRHDGKGADVFAKSPC